MPTIVHFDISADNIDRVKKFYSELFHWKIEKFPGPTEYFIIETESLEGEKGISGGIAKRENQKQAITNFIAIPSIDEYIAKVEKLGGKIIEPKQTIPTIGYIAGCQDTEGNIFGLMEIDENAKAS
jgi:predicted enzyme related to lactoylglutathione lyase